MNEFGKALKFIGPYIEANDFWCSAILWTLGALILLVFLLIAVYRFSNFLDIFEGYLSLAVGMYVFIILSLILIFGCLKLDTYRMKKFPLVFYNEKTRFIDER